MASASLFMAGITAAAMLAGNGGEAQVWQCSNAGLAEVNCTDKGCEAAAEFTPMEIDVGTERMSMCAYSACFEGGAEPLAKGGSHVVIRSTLRQTTVDAEAPSVMTVAIHVSSRAGTALWNGFAIPLRCTPVRRPTTAKSSG